MPYERRPSETGKYIEACGSGTHPRTVFCSDSRADREEIQNNLLQLQRILLTLLILAAVLLHVV
jgi:hypothetical protein